MSNLELKILTPDEGVDLEPITFNYDELKQEIGQTMSLYKSMTYTDDAMQTAKADLATLRKFGKAINDKKIEVKKRVLKPYETFENQIKELLGMVDEPIQLIDSQVKEYETKIKTAKLDEAKAYFEGKLEELGLQNAVQWSLFASMSPFEYSNLSSSIKKIKEDIDTRVQKCREDYDTIQDMSDHPYQFQMLERYEITLDLTAAIKKGNELRDEAERKAEYERVKAESAKSITAESITTPHKTAPVAPQAPDKLYTLSFQVTGTLSQLEALSAYLANSGVSYEQI